jgi:hypothetical protein
VLDHLWSSLNSCWISFLLNARPQMLREVIVCVELAGSLTWKLQEAREWLQNTLWMHQDTIWAAWLP